MSLYSLESHPSTSYPKGQDPAEVADQLERLKLSDNRKEFASSLVLYHLVHSSRSAFQAALFDLVRPSPRRLFSPLEPSSEPECPPTTPFLRIEDLGYAVRAARALSEETFNSIAYFALLSDQGATKYERIVLGWSEGKVRERVMKVMQKAYLEVGLGWNGRMGGYDHAGAKRWVEAEGKPVLDGRVIMKNR